MLEYALPLIEGNRTIWFVTEILSGAGLEGESAAPLGLAGVAGSRAQGVGNHVSRVKALLPGRLYRALRSAYAAVPRIVLGPPLRLLRLAGYYERGRILRRTFESSGLTVARADDFYSPLPVSSEIRRNVGRWSQPSALVGIDYDLETMKQLVRECISDYSEELAHLPSNAECKDLGYGPGFTDADSVVLYALLRRCKPARYVEIGSGVSTYIASLAAVENDRDGTPTQITCIDPYPSPAIGANDQVTLLAKQAQDVELSFFEQLQSGDFLFIDTSHVVRVDGEVPYLYLEVLPRLREGVMIHSHDIPFPYNTPYPPDHCVLDAEWPLFRDEPMLLQAFLAFNESFQVVLSVPMLRYHSEEFLIDGLPTYEGLDEDDEATQAGSLWFKRIR